MLTDIEINQQAKRLKMTTIAKKLGVPSQYLEPYGKDKAKISLDILPGLTKRPDGKLILVTAINPTKAGEGKTTTTIGLGQAFYKVGVKSLIALREPSLGPVFGLKGGATGGGYSQVVPMEDINLHFTGDMHAITSANNLISATLDNHIFQGNELQINPERVVLKRAMDMNDRALRQIRVGQGSGNGVERTDGFIITVASELMAILCLATSIDDFRNRVNRMIVAYNMQGQPITVAQLGITGSVMVLMKEALKPNLVQTLENTPVLIHGGPFANIAHGSNSLLATKMGLKLADVVVTEAGFGADLGAEKFLNITSRVGELAPDYVVLVATIRALKLHGGVTYEELSKKNVTALLKGSENLQKHIENIQKFHLPFVVAINRFDQDDLEEIEALKKWCQSNHYPVFLSTVFKDGGKGALELAKFLKNELWMNPKPQLQPLYRLDLPIRDKIERIAKEIYGAKLVEFSPEALSDIQRINALGYDQVPVCMAKTPSSLTDDPTLVGRPKDFTLHVKRINLSAGAGFVVALTGSILTMPGLPKVPAALAISLDDNGRVKGLK